MYNVNIVITIKPEIPDQFELSLDSVLILPVSWMNSLIQIVALTVRLREHKNFSTAFIEVLCSNLV